MCDTFVALTDATREGTVVFGKNSDRPQGEIQDVVTVPAQSFPEGATVGCTYLEIPQVRRTYATILSKPRWMWGAEMGANECGVVAGNEAVWTTQPYASTGLLGMDLLRLGLERGETAEAAVQVVIDLMAEYGQGGNCAEGFALNYHNSYIFADPREAWVLETAGRYWVAERVRTGTRSISNNLSIRTAGTRRHPEVVQAAQKLGRCTSEADFDFAQLFSETGVEDEEAFPQTREGRVRSLCRQHWGDFDGAIARSILRDHEGNVCMHGGFESRGSQVSVLSPDGCVHEFIEAPFPCQQEYRPFQFAMMPSSSQA